MARLVFYRGDVEERAVELGESDLRIGRGPQNDVVLADPDKTVSRFHAELRREGERYVLIDLNSQNGTWVDGQRVQRAVLGQTASIVMGAYHVVLDAGESAQAGQQAAGAAGARSSSDTLVGQAEDVRPAPDLARRSAGSRRRGAPPRPGIAAPQPGLIAWLARQPKPLILGGFAFIVFAILGLAEMFSPKAPGPERDATRSRAEVARPTTDHTLALIDRHLNEGRVLLERGEARRAIVEHFDRILLVDSNHAEALELKMRAEELIKKAEAQGPRPEPVAPAPARPAPPERAQSSRPAGGERPAPARTNAEQRRTRELEQRHADAKAALERGDYALAVSLLEALERDQPGFADVEKLLEMTRAGIAAHQRAQARAALEQGSRYEEADELGEALKLYARALELDVASRDASAAVERIRERMKEAGEDAYKRARQYDALGRMPEAVALYERAVALLPDGDALREQARRRLEALRQR